MTSDALFSVHIAGSVVTASGLFVAETAPRLLAALRLLHSFDVRDVLVQLEGLVAVDTSAVCALRAAQQQAVREGWALRIRAQSPRLRPLLEGCMLEPAHVSSMFGRMPCAWASVIPANLQ